MYIRYVRAGGRPRAKSVAYIHRPSVDAQHRHGRLHTDFPGAGCRGQGWEEGSVNSKVAVGAARGSAIGMDGSSWGLNCQTIDHK